MTLISSLITDAFREANIIPLGASPNANQLTEALRLYNQNVGSIYGSEAGEGLPDWPLGAFGVDDPNYTFPFDNFSVVRPRINRRLIVTNLQAMTVYLTNYPQDGARMAVSDPFARLATVPITLDGNGRTIQGNPTLVLNINGTFQEWFYRADKGDWVKLNALLSTDDNPFPSEFDSFFYLGLAMRLNPRMGREMDPQSVAVYKSARAQFIAHYLQSEPLEVDDSISWPFLSRQSFSQGRGFSSTSAFNRGWYGGS